MTKPFLLLQLRPEVKAADEEYASFIRSTGLTEKQLMRIRMDEGMPDINIDGYSGVIVGGGPCNVSDPDEEKYDYQRRFEPKLKKLIREIIDRDYPYFGACYGLGILGDVLGGRVGRERYSENVEALAITLGKDAQSDALLQGMPVSFRAFAGHKESCQELPPNSILLASSATCPIHMIRTGSNVYATQFHPELDSYGLEVRINVYKNAGYFPPEDAEKLIEMGHQEVITVPPELLRRFVTRYQS